MKQLRFRYIERQHTPWLKVSLSATIQKNRKIRQFQYTWLNGAKISNFIISRVKSAIFRLYLLYVTTPVPGQTLEKLPHGHKIQLI